MPEKVVSSKDLYLAATDPKDARAGRRLQTMARASGDTTAIPAGTSLVCEADWAAMVADAGGEVFLLAALGVTVDARVDEGPPLAGR